MGRNTTLGSERIASLVQPARTYRWKQSDPWMLSRVVRLNDVNDLLRVSLGVIKVLDTHLIAECLVFLDRIVDLLDANISTLGVVSLWAKCCGNPFVTRHVSRSEVCKSSKY